MSTKLDEWRGLVGWLVEHRDVPDGESMYFDMGNGSGSEATMGLHREHAEDLRELIAADARLIAKLHGELATMMERRAA